MLLRRGWIWNGSKRAWSQGHRLWLRSLRFEQEADQVVLDDYLLAIEQVEQRLRWLEQHIEAASQQPTYAERLGPCAASVASTPSPPWDSWRICTTSCASTPPAA